MARFKAVFMFLLFAAWVVGLDANETGVTVICGDGNMTVALEKARYSYLNASLLHLRGSWCRATESATHLYLNTDLNDCSTTFIETDSSIIFMNEIQGDIGRISSVVTRDHDFDLQFNCSYSRKKFLSLSFTPEGIVIPPGQVGFGNLTFKMDFYRSSSYVTPYSDSDYPLSVPLNEFVYLQYSVESRASLAVMAVNCKATKDGSFHSSPSYDIIRNGCPQDTTMEYSYSSTQSFQRLKIRTFRFFNNYETVYFHCELLACHRNTPNSRCSQGCVNSKKRKRRGVTTRDEQIQPSTTKSYVVKRGPILITQEKEEPKDTGNTDKQAVVIGSATAAGGVGLVGLIVLAVLFVKYRIARLLLNRSRVGDLYTTQDEHLSRRTAYIQEDDMIEKDESL